VNSGRLSEYLLDADAVGNAKETADGHTIVYSRSGFPWTRPRYQGSAASQIWKYDLASHQSKPLRNNGFQHLWPNVLPSGDVLTVTVEEKTPSTGKVGVTIPKNVDNAKRTPNVYEVSDNGSAKRLTDCVGTGVRFLTASRDGKTMAYECDGDVYVGAVNGQAHKVAFTAVLDDKTTQQERVVLKDGVTVRASAQTEKPPSSPSEANFGASPPRKPRVRMRMTRPNSPSGPARTTSPFLHRMERQFSLSATVKALTGFIDLIWLPTPRPPSPR